MRDVDIIYFKESFDNITNTHYRVEIIPGFPESGTRADLGAGEFEYKELPETVLIDTTEIDAALHDIPLGIMETPVVTISMELQDSTANFRQIVKTPSPLRSDFDDGDTDARFDLWYADKVTTTWVFKKKPGGAEEWTTRFIGAQRALPGWQVKQYKDDSGRMIEEYNAEIVSIGSYLLQNIPKKEWCDYMRFTADGHIERSEHEYMIDVVHNILLSGSFWTTFVTICQTKRMDELNPIANVLTYYRVSDIFYTINKFCSILYAALLRNSTVNSTTSRMPHENILWETQVGDSLVHDNLWFVGEERGWYYVDDDGFVINRADTLLGGLLVEERIKETYIPGAPPYIFIDNPEFLDYENCYDLYKDISEQFASKLIWRFDGLNIVYAFEPLKQKTTDNSIVLKLPNNLSADKAITKDSANKVQRGCEVNIDSSHLLSEDKESFAVFSPASIRSEQKIEVKMIFHNLPGIPSRSDVIVRKDLRAGSVTTPHGLINKARVVYSKLCYLGNDILSTERQIRFQTTYHNGDADPPTDIDTTGDQMYRVGNTVDVLVEHGTGGEFVYSETIMSGWGGVYAYPNHSLAVYRADMLQIQQSSCLPFAIASTLSALFSSPYQAGTTLSIPHSVAELHADNVGDVVSIETFDTELDSRINLDAVTILSCKEGMKDNVSTVELFIFA